MNEIKAKTKQQTKNRQPMPRVFFDVISVATQFLTHVLINFQKNPKIAKNIENPKKYIFNTFASFLAFLACLKRI